MTLGPCATSIDSVYRRLTLAFAHYTRMAGSDKRFTLEEVKQAIVDCGGVITNVAARLECSRSCVYNYINDYYPDELRPLIEVSKEEMIQDAQVCIRDAILGGDWHAAKYVMNSQGGWSEKQHIDVTSDGDKVSGVIILPSNGREGDDE